MHLYAHDSLTEPDDDGCGDADCQEDVGAVIVSDIDAAPVLEAAEHILNLVPLAVEYRVMRDGGFVV